MPQSLDEIAMEYAIEARNPDIKHPEDQFHQQHLRYEEIVRRTGKERADKLIDDAFHALKLVGV